MLDGNGNTVFAIEKKAESEKSTDTLEYLQASLKQVILGNYTDDVNLVGTLEQILLGLSGFDLPADIRDLVYDITHFKSSPEHTLQTILDAVSLLPIIGGVKYADEAWDALKAAAKYEDEAVSSVKIANKLPWNSWQTYEKVNKNGQVYAKIGNRLYSEHAVNRMQPSGNRFGPNIYQGLNAKDYGRSIAPQYVEEVINSTKAVFQPETGNFVHTLGTVKVIVNAEGAVVTIITYQ